MAQPDLLLALCGIAGQVFYRPEAVDTFGYGLAVVQGAAGEGTFVVGIGIGKTARLGTIICHIGQSGIGGRWVGEAKNRLFRASNYGRQGIINLDGAGAVIAACNMPQLGSNLYPGLVTRERIG